MTARPAFTVDELADLELTISADELLSLQFPELRWAVPGIIPEGLTVLAAAPKLGKSWLALGIAVAIASGGRALGALPVDAGDVLVLSLEDSRRRLQERLVTLLEDGAPAPARLHLATTWPRLGEGGMDQLAEWLELHPAARLVVVDTWVRVRDRVKDRDRRSTYELDVDGLSPLKALADRFRVSVLVVHHTRKMAAADKFDLVNGTQGVNGGADTVLVLERKRQERDGYLHVTGRDVDEARHALRWEPGSGSWTVLDLEAPTVSAERQAIADYVGSCGARPASPSEIATALDRPRGTIRRLLYVMKRAGQLAATETGYLLPEVSEQGEQRERAQRYEQGEQGEQGNREGEQGEQIHAPVRGVRSVHVEPPLLAALPDPADDDAPEDRDDDDLIPF